MRDVRAKEEPPWGEIVICTSGVRERVRKIEGSRRIVGFGWFRGA
jgi:hypothetical protein